MNIHLERKQGIIRLYMDGNSYELKSPYSTVISYIFLSKNTVFMYAARGIIGAKGKDLITSEFKKYGAEKIIFEKSESWGHPEEYSLTDELYCIDI